MTQQEVLIILAMAATFDARLTAGDDTEKLNRSKAWHAALDKDLSFEDAKQFVIAHYADHKTAIMPADINLRWRKNKAQNRPIETTKQLVRQIEADRSRATGMPQRVREQLDELLQRKPQLPD
jgi:hypothetical protein